MIKGLMDWIDDRSGIRGLVKEALYEKVPGGARWRYVWGSCLTFVFFTQPACRCAYNHAVFRAPYQRMHTPGSGARTRPQCARRNTFLEARKGS